jgi:hypothetical protein
MRSRLSTRISRRSLAGSALAAVGLRRGALAGPGTPLRVVTDFPGASATVEALDQTGRAMRLSPTAHPDRGWACWWYFKLEGITPGETITLDVGTDAFAKPDQAFFSLDDRNWFQTAPGERVGNRIVYRQRVEAASAWFAWGPPFGLRHARELVAETVRRSPHARAFELCKSRDGHSVPALRVTQGDAAEKYGIWIEARQHAWESGSSWVGKGILDWLVSDEPAAEELRKKSVVYFVPIMDVDNVERGAGGKNQKPHDHNRDWTDAPHWPEVRAAQKQIIALDAARSFDLFIDLHNPAPNDREPEFFLAPRELLSEKGRRNLDAFLAAARAEMTGPLAFRGKVRESGPRYDPEWERISKNWVARNTHSHVVSVTLETAWNTPHSTQAGYQQVGRELGQAVARYLQRSPR